MFSIETNAPVVARAFMTRRKRLEPALKRGMKRWAPRVEAEAIKNTTGPGDASPHSYPVPVRSGTLRRSSGYKTAGLRAVVFFDAIYAPVIHRDRPFLDDAGESVDGQAIMHSEMLRIL